MKIYVGHSTSYDFARELYQPLKYSVEWEKHIFILPHEFKKEPTFSKDVISNCDLVIAEVSYPSTGLGIELGWANVLGRDILCLFKNETRPSASLKIISSNFLSYSDSTDLIEKLDQWLNNYSNKNNHHQNATQLLIK